MNARKFINILVLLIIIYCTAYDLKMEHYYKMVPDLIFLGIFSYYVHADWKKKK